MYLEIERFRLRVGSDEAALRAADATVQAEFAYHQPGLVRRTTARSGADWVVVTLWSAAEDAERAHAVASGHHAVATFDTLIDETSRAVAGYETLD